MQKVYNNKYNFTICGDVNVNYLIANNSKNQLDAVLHSYPLACIAELPTKIIQKSHTAFFSILLYIFVCTEEMTKTLCLKYEVYK